MKICNVAARKFLITIPNIQYWLSFFTAFESGNGGGFDSLKTLLEELCCTDLSRWLRQYVASAGDVFTVHEPFGAGQPKAPILADEKITATSSPAATLLWQALATSGREVNVATLMLAAMGAHDRKGQPLASDFELANPTDFVLMNQVVAPMVRAVLPGAMGWGLAGRAAPSAAGPSINDLAKEVGDLKQTIKNQQKAIDQLKKSRNR